MVFESGLSGARGERAAGDEVFDELIILRERRGDVEGNGVFSDKGDVNGFGVGRGHWSEERIVNWRRPRVLLSVSSGRFRWYLVISSGAKTCSAGSHELSASG